MKSAVLQPYWPALLIGGLLPIAALAIYVWYRKRPTPEELERRRRELIGKTGKMGDGNIIEFQDALISYSYHVRGIEYTTSQDVSALGAQLPCEPWGIIGHISVKYDPRNPANSIVISEHWNGIRK